MKAIIKYYESGFAGPAPEIEDLEESKEVNSKEALTEYAKALSLPASAEYAAIYADDEDEPIISVTRDGIRDLENDEWVVEPEDEE